MDIQSLVQAVTLTDVRTIETRGSLKLTEQGPLGEWGDVSPQADFDMSVNPVSWGRELETWFRVTIESEQFTIVAAVAVLYTRDGDDDIDPALRTEFIERVSVMTAYPYLRALVQRLASELRIGNLTLGVLRPGEFRVQEPGEQAQPANGSGSAT